MQKFKDDELQDTAVDGDGQREQDYPIRAEGKYVAAQTPWPRDEEKEASDIARATKRKPYAHRRQGNRWDQYGESSSAASSEARIASDYVQSESTWGPYESAHRDKRIDFKRPTEGKANGPDGLATSDNRSRTTGVVLLSGSRLPATTAHGRKCLIGKDHNGLPQLEGP